MNINKIIKLHFNPYLFMMFIIFSLFLKILLIMSIDILDIPATNNVYRKGLWIPNAFLFTKIAFSSKDSSAFKADSFVFITVRCIIFRVIH